jgi:uncharacterized protein (TIGR02001 family)
MTQFGRLGRVVGASGVMTMLFAAGALADGYSTKDAPVEEGRKFSYSVTVGGTSDYVFRGVSQTFEDPAFQAALDISYGIFYAGIWGSNVDFNDAPKANAEIDLYAGIKPTWGPVTFDLGVLYYWYPDGDDFANFNGVPGQLDYVEFKAGYSLASPWIKGLTSGTMLYWSPDYSFETGDVFTIESSASYALPQFWIFSPAISGAYGSVYGDSKDGFSVGGTSEDEYKYWNAGLSLAVEKFTFDFRYWDSDIDVVGAGGTVCASQGLCDERFVFSAKVVLP